MTRKYANLRIELLTTTTAVCIVRIGSPKLPYVSSEVSGPQNRLVRKVRLIVRKLGVPFTSASANRSECLRRNPETPAGRTGAERTNSTRATSSFRLLWALTSLIVSLAGANLVSATDASASAAGQSVESSSAQAPAASILDGAAVAAPLKALTLHHGAGTSTNWSGYVDTGSKFTNVSGTWTVPQVKCPWFTTQYSASWVGIDGDGSSTVEQLGTEQDCSFGTPRYSAWYEMYPAGSVTLPSNYPVTPGDSINASVSDTTGSWNLTMSDSTKGWTFTYAPPAPATPPAQASAEWIVEAPSLCFFFGCFGTALSNFGSETFSNALVSANGQNGNIGSFPSTLFEMSNQAGNLIRANPSPLSNGGATFTDTWAHS